MQSDDKYNINFHLVLKLDKQGMHDAYLIDRRTLFFRESFYQATKPI